MKACAQRIVGTSGMPMIHTGRKYCMVYFDSIVFKFRPLKLKLVVLYVHRVGEAKTAVIPEFDHSLIKYNNELNSANKCQGLRG